MSFVRRLDIKKPDIKKPSALIVAVVMVLTSGAIAFLLIGDAFAPVSAPPPAAGPSYHAADTQVPSVPAEAGRTAADQTPREPAAPHQNPDDPSADQLSASSEDSPPSASEQRIFKSRKALETVDPRELLRQATMPK